MLTTEEARKRSFEVNGRLRVIQDEANAAEALLIAAVLAEVADELPQISGFYYTAGQEYDDENYYTEVRVSAEFEFDDDVSGFSIEEAWEQKDVAYGWSEGGCQALFSFQESTLTPNDLRLKLGNAAVSNAEQSEV